MADKKILQEEMLSDDDLENVAGGSWNEMCGDQDFFAGHGVHSYLCASRDIYMYKSGVENMWAFFGIKAKVDIGNGANKYSIYRNGDMVEISREEAMNHVNEQMQIPERRKMIESGNYLI